VKILKYEHFIALAIIPVWVLLLAVLAPNSLEYWLTYWWMFPIALVIATVVNTVGISGAALFVPFFILVFPLMAEPLAAEQSVKLGLITESFGLSSSAFAFFRFGLIDRKLGLFTVLVALPFVIIGAVLSFYVSENVLRLFIAVVLMIGPILMLSRKRKESKEQCIENEVIGEHHDHPEADNVTLTDKNGKIYKYCRTCGRKARTVVYSIGAIFQGAAGFGIGEIGILSMVFTKIPIRVAIGTSHMVVAVTAIVASLAHILQSAAGDTGTPWNILIMTVPAVIIGGQMAPYVSSRLKTSLLENFVAVLFIVLSVAMFWISLSRII